MPRNVWPYLPSSLSIGIHAVPQVVRRRERELLSAAAESESVSSQLLGPEYLEWQAASLWGSAGSRRLCVSLCNLCSASSGAVKTDLDSPCLLRCKRIAILEDRCLQCRLLMSLRIQVSGFRVQGGYPQALI